ncbi:MAG: ABC transporter ATP-binding protein [Pseudomonadota bacterium]
MLTLTALSKTYHGPRNRTVLSAIDFHLNAGEYIAIMGESGVGKSTLLNLIAGLDTPDSGEIVFDGKQLNTLDDNALTILRREKMGFVFQAFHVLPHLTVLQNIMLPLSLSGIALTEATQRALTILKAVGLHERASSRPQELSGGELQRVSIARGLVNKPRLLLADEPTGNLDAATGSHILALLRDQLKDTGAAGILVTHSAAAAATADRTYILGSQGLNIKAP